MGDEEPREEVEPDSVQVDLVWTTPENQPFVFANQFVCQFTQDVFLLTLGSVAPPVLLGPLEERERAARAISYLPVQVEGRFTMGRENVETLIRILTENLATYDRQREEDS